MRILWFRNIKRSLILFSSILIVFLSLLFLSFSIEQNSFLDKLSLTLSNDVHTYQATFTDELTGITSDVQVIKQLLTYNDVMQTDGVTTSFITPADKAAVQDSILAITQSIKYFDQIRILDIQGMELVRINNNNGDAYIVDDADLQDKSDRYYFTESITLGDYCIYISQLDLNVENGEIEIVNGAYKPVLRFATPLYSSTNQLLGLLVVNYLAEDIFNSLVELKRNDDSKIELLNEDGYFLLAENDEIEFGFMFDDHLDETIDKYTDFDVLENTTSEIQQFIISGNIYTIMTMDDQLFSDSIANKVGSNITLVSNSGSFIIYSHLNYLALDEYQQRLRIYLILAVVSIIISYIITRLSDEIEYTKKQRMSELKYLAEHDYLTNLPNRSHLMKLLTEHLNKNKHISLMFLDLDGFKNINDHYGHLIGDASLIESASRIVNNIREQDIVARVGGDEFIILFDDLNDKNNLAEIAKRLLSAFKESFIFDDLEIHLGVSIGIAIHEEDQTLDDLINAADQAMYDIKAHNKNNYAFFK